VSTATRARRLPLVAEATLAFGVGLATFVAVGGLLELLDAAILAVAIGVACVAGVVVAARRWGIVYAAPAAFGGLVAFDWFQFPPTHPFAVPDAGDLAWLAAYVGVAVFVGELAARAGRHATVTERARSELAEEQAALRRVATRVARREPPSAIFAAVAREVSTLLGMDGAIVVRYVDGATAIEGVEGWSATGEAPLQIPRRPIEDTSLARRILDTGRAARIDDYGRWREPVPAIVAELAIRSSVAAPIVVDGGLWGAIVTWSQQPRPLPADVESRLTDFTELVATAVSDAASRAELAESRARIAAAADEERRRVVRDLHDGAQQRLVHTVITLKMARQALERGADGAALVEEALGHAEQANAEVRELAHGIMPAALSRGGLSAGVDALAERMPLPVEVDVDVPRLPSVLEATAYFVVAEALTNVAKHAGASCAMVAARVADGTLTLEVRDDGVGGAREDGSGLLGLADRVAVFDGRLRVVSPPGDGTVVSATIPLPTDVRHLAADGSMPGATRPVTAPESG
jgi:signal transduction histidine kinase